MRDEDIICGASSVGALFARRPDAVRRLFYTPAQRQVVGPWCAVLAAARKPYRMIEAEELTTAANTTHHGGIAAVADARAVAIWDIANPPALPFVLALDGIGNPHNLGAIARSAAFFGVPALLLAEGLNHAMPSDAAYRTAEGGLEWLDLYRTRDLAAALAGMDRQYRTVAAVLDPQARNVAELPRDRPTALVLGHEERGVSPEVAAACRRQVRIPGRGHVQSLNVAQAAAVLLHTLTGSNPGPGTRTPGRGATA